MAHLGLLLRPWRRGHTPRSGGLLPYLLILAIYPFLVLSDRQAYRTAYGCEGATLSITCEPGHVINVIRANYGRFSITICNNQGNTEWSVNCQSPRTHRVLAERCSGENNCIVVVSSKLFGDACPGTFKYIEIHYTCGLATTTTTTARPRPPWFVETREPVWLPPNLNASVPTVETSLVSSSTTLAKSSSTSLSTTSSTTTTTSTSTTTSTTTESTTTTTTTSTTSKPPSPPAFVVTASHETNNLNYSAAEPKKNSSHEVFVQHPTLSSDSLIPSSTPASPAKPIPITPPNFVGVPYDDVPWCAPSLTRGLYWNWTKAGETAVLVCPGGATGSARRKCLVGEWKGPADLSECRSAWLTALKKRANTQDSVLAVATDLAKVTASKALYGGDLITAARLIKSLSRRMMQDVAVAFPEPHQRQALVTEFLLAALETGSALVSAGLVGPWGDLSAKERRFAVTELMVGLEEATFLLGEVLPSATQAVHFKSHVLASARAVAADGSPVRFPSLEDELVDWVYTDSVVLPPEAVLENSEGSSTRVIFLTYRHLEDLLAPEDNNFQGSKRRNVSRIVNSRVLSASLGHGRHIQLPEPVVLTFSLLKHDNVSNPICVFWDYTTFGWSDEGCYVHSFNRTHVTCKCNHLTNFAVIMEESSGPTAEETVSPLRILAYVGCFVCVLCVAGSILVFTLFKGISSTRTYIQRHVCVCLLMAELAFLIGVWRTDLPVLCGVTAGVLHYSVLAAFAWMFLEGVHVYLSVTRPVESDCIHLRWWHYLMAYGSPLLVVCGAAIVDPFSFGTPHYCWLRTDNYFVFSLVAPALFFLALEVALLGAALIRSCKFNPDEALKTKEMARLASSRSWLRCAVTLVLLMVLTWSLGLLLLHQPSLPVAVAFCVFNALHGIFIFVYYCLRNQKVREWCTSSESEHTNAWIPQLFRNVFLTEKQTYSPNNNNAPPPESSSGVPPPPPPALPHHPHPQAISQALNHALNGGGAPPSMQQFLPTLCHVGGLKGHASPQPTAPPFPAGVTSTMGSRGSLRQVGGSVGCPLPMGSLHQSLPRSRPHPSTTTTTTTATDTPIPQASLNPPPADEEASYKSFSRDSGHGGSEQEDSPRTPWIGQHQRHSHAHSHPHAHAQTLAGDLKGSSYMNKMNSLNHQPKVDSQGCYVPNSYSTSLSPGVSVTPAISAMLRASAHRSHSPWNHTYMEIETEPDPVYEEIERERWARGGSEVMQVSDLSDEDVKRGPPSDVSRQSSRSYGDSRPLLPYLQSQGRSAKESQFALSEERLRDFNAAQMCRDLEHLQKVQQHLSRENLMTVAVLNGEQVVCRLSSPSHTSGPQSLPIIHEGNNRSSTTHSTGHSPTSNGYPPSQYISSRSHNQQQMRQFNEC